MFGLPTPRVIGIALALTLVGVGLIITLSRIRHALGKVALLNTGAFALAMIITGHLSLLPALLSIVILWSSYYFVARRMPQREPSASPAADPPESANPPRPGSR